MLRAAGVAAALLERETELATLDGALTSAAGGAGSVVLVAGEAGIGKTSLLRAFLSMSADRARILHGVCDDLTPRTFGPSRDAVRRGPLAEALTAGNRDAVFAPVLDELTGSSLPTVKLGVASRREAATAAVRLAQERASGGPGLTPDRAGPPPQRPRAAT